jgi:hypothetical protein
MQEMQKLKRRLTVQSFALYLALLGGAGAVGGRGGVYGFSFGYIMGLLLFYLLAAALEGAVKKGSAGARGAAMVHYAFRYLLTFAILLTALLREDMNIFWALAGLLLLKGLILGSSILGTLRLRPGRG